MIAITGATGQVGSELLHVLINKGISPRLLVRDAGKVEKSIHSSSVVQFEYENPETYESSLSGVSRLFLVCPPTVQESTLEGFVEACKKHGVRQIVFVSGMGADQRPEHFCSIFSEIIRKTGIPSVFLRANWFFQNLRSQTSEAIRNLHLLRYPDGRKSISFVDARDIAEVAAHFLTSEIQPGEIGLDITGPESLTHEEVAKLLSKHLPYQVSYEEISDEEAIEKLGYNAVWMGLFHDVQNGLVSPVSKDVENVLHKPPRNLESFIIENKNVWIS